jgi:mannonate dehydratase
VAIKWLPSAMNIDPASPRCRPFYDALQAAGLPLIVHCGEEKAAPGARRDAFVNPLRLRQPLALGVRVIVAHAASLGHAQDTDRPSQPTVPAFDLFARLVQEQGDQPGLMADLSAVFQRNRSADVWRRVLGQESWHARLLQGSDYPLPGVVPLSAPAQLAAAGLLEPRHVAPLLRLREHNALLFDVVLKRLLRLGSITLPASVFEARALAQPPASA